MDAWIDTYHAIRSLVRRDLYRLSDRQRRRIAGGRQSPASRHESRGVGRSSSGSCRSSRRSTRSSSAWPTRSARGSTVFRRSSSWAATRASARRVVSSMRGSSARPSATSSRRSSWAAGPIRMVRPGVQVGYLLDGRCERGLLSHADRLAPRSRQGSALPRARRLGASSCSAGVFGVFYYRSANPQTLNMLKEFMPVPVDALVEPSSPRVRTPWTSARARFARWSTRAPVRSTSATCRSAARTRRWPRSWNAPRSNPVGRSFSSGAPARALERFLERSGLAGAEAPAYRCPSPHQRWRPPSMRTVSPVTKPVSTAWTTRRATSPAPP